MDLRELAPTPSERGIIIGTTGSGKTTLATQLLRLYSRTVAIDPKQTLGAGGERRGAHLPGYELAATPRDLERLARRKEHIQYRPDLKHQNPDDWERIYDWIYRRGSTFVYTDEIFDIHHWSRPPNSFRRCITSGRELGIGMLHATQRPRGIDRRIITEAERFYVFHLRDPDDQRFLRSRIGIGRLPSFGFWYSLDREPFDEPAIKRLKI
jgi:DNA helicase HerA-like ATPase